MIQLKNVSRRTRVAILVIMLSPSLFGCTGRAAKPVAQVLWKAVVYVGQKAAEVVTFKAIENLFDRLLGSSSRGDAASTVTQDPYNPLRGKCRGPIRIQNADNSNKELMLVDFPVVRQSTSSQWTIDPSYLASIEAVVK